MNAFTTWGCKLKQGESGGGGGRGRGQGPDSVFCFGARLCFFCEDSVSKTACREDPRQKRQGGEKRVERSKLPTPPAAAAAAPLRCALGFFVAAARAHGGAGGYIGGGMFSGRLPAQAGQQKGVVADISKGKQQKGGPT